ncbi:MAG: TetR family transcriptional regulator [Rhodomicrobiaceae bacterium]
MLDLTSTRGKIVDAALRLAATHGWSGLSLDRIANEAGLSLTDFRKEFSSKAEILAAYARAVDDAALARVDPADADVAPRDRLFDVLMTRFELMAPHKEGIRRIRRDLRTRPGEGIAQLGTAARSLYWMLAAAGIDAEGSRGVIRVPGLMSVYARAFDTWLEDDDPGLARTMAALDSRLRRGERAMRRIDDFGAAAVRFCEGLVRRGGRRRDGEPEPQPDLPPEPSPSAPPQTNGSTGPGPASAV